jgi:hypothetical protein
MYAGVLGPLYSGSIQWWALKRQLFPLLCVGAYHSDDLETHRRLIDTSDYALLADENAAGMVTHMPFSRLHAEIDALVIDQSNFRPLADFETDTGGRYRLFARPVQAALARVIHEDFAPFGSLEGFLSTEGVVPGRPYPVRWGLHPESSIAFEAGEAGRAQVRVVAKSDGPQSIVFELNGMPLHRTPLSGWAEFDEEVIPFACEPGTNRLVLRYEVTPPAASDGHRRAALFRCLTIEIADAVR